MNGGNIMKLNTLFILNAIVALVFGLGFLLVPATLVSLYDVTLSDEGIFVARLYGTVILGLAVLTWLVRNSGESEARGAIILAQLFIWAAGFVVLVYGQLSGLMNVLGWVMIVLFLLFTVGYGYFQFVKKGSD
jgi:FtsH-binding integral membrane protein